MLTQTMPRRATGHAKNNAVRIESIDHNDIKILKRMIFPNTVKHADGDVIHALIHMFKEKKIGASPFLEERQSQSPSLNPRLNEGAIENDEAIYKNLYEDSIKSNTNFVKRVERLCKMLGISYQEGMKLEPDAPIQRQ